MNAALPVIQQQPPATQAGRGKSDKASEGNGQDFGKFLKAEGKAGASEKVRDENGDASVEPSSDLESAKDGLAEAIAPSEKTKSGKDKKAAEEATDGLEALLPFLTVTEPVKPTPSGSAEPAHDAKNAEAAAGKAQSSKSQDHKAAARMGDTVSVLPQPAESTTATPRQETTFGKTLIANLNDLAMQASNPAGQDDGRQPDGDLGDVLQEGRGARRDPGTLISDAVSRARETRDTGDRKADLRPAATDQKAQPAPLPQAPLSTGAPVVQALATHPAATAGLQRSAAPNPAVNHSVPGTPQALKIQLHPLDLGTVTANLRISGNQLSIEIQVETTEAYSKLSSETEAIARSLRSHGISVEEVVIQPPQVQAGAPVRDASGGMADTSGNAGRNFSTGAESGQSGGSGQPNRDAGRDNGHEIEKLPSAELRNSGGSTNGGVYI